jgi:hypothetical protein
MEQSPRPCDSPFLPLPLQALETTSAPLLGLASRAPLSAETAFSATPHPSHFPHTPQSPAEPCGKICIKDKFYILLKILWESKGFIGRGTVCYLVQLDEEEYIIKDYWVKGGEGNVSNEIKMLQSMSGFPGVPKLVDYWLVERTDGKIDTTQDYHYAHLSGTRNSHWSTDNSHRTHVYLVMKPRARPLHAFRTLRKFVKAIRDIVISPF